MAYTSPIEALQFLKDHERDIDFALVAVNMKEIHGFQFLDISRESHKNLQVISKLAVSLQIINLLRSIYEGLLFISMYDLHDQVCIF
jgi:CheY-like chemotaxis protein